MEFHGFQGGDSTNHACRSCYGAGGAETPTPPGSLQQLGRSESREDWACVDVGSHMLKLHFRRILWCRLRHGSCWRCSLLPARVLAFSLIRAHSPVDFCLTQAIQASQSSWGARKCTGLSLQHCDRSCPRQTEELARGAEQLPCSHRQCGWGRTCLVLTDRGEGQIGESALCQRALRLFQGEVPPEQTFEEQQKKEARDLGIERRPRWNERTLQLVTQWSC